MSVAPSSFLVTFKAHIESGNDESRAGADLDLLFGINYLRNKALQNRGKAPRLTGICAKIDSSE
jgi:hypothetical protein